MPHWRRGRHRPVSSERAGTTDLTSHNPGYGAIHGDIVPLLDAARRAAARSVNALMTDTSWETGRRIVKF
jgi:hypothetical protein